MTQICLVPGLVLYALASLFYLILLFGYPTGSVAKVCTFLGVLLQLLYLVLFYLLERGMPVVTGIGDILFFVSLGSVFLFLWFLFRYRLQSLGAFFLPLAFMLFVFSLDKTHDSFYLVYAFSKNRWFLGTHLVSALLSLVFLFGCFVLGLSFWLHERRLKEKKLDALTFNLPPLMLNEKLALNLLKIGFVFLTLVLISGSMLLSHVVLSIGQRAWHIAFAIVAWTVYALVLNRHWTGVRGKKILLLSFLGFASLAALILWN